ncbi:MAG: CotH kinase family protein [Crocinitomicaceae bacterium]
MRLLTLIIFTQLSVCVFSQNLVINEVMSSNSTSIFDEDGDFVDWIELYNNSNSAIDLEGYYLSDELDETQKWTFPSVTVNPNDFLLVFASGKDRVSSSQLHSNFKISSSGERIILSNASGTILDNLNLPSLKSNQTYGRVDDGTANFGIISNPTPGLSNNSEQLLKVINFSKPSGFYAESFSLEMTCADSVYYTTDGSIPSLNSKLYVQAIPISKPLQNNLSIIPTTHLAFDPDIWPNKISGFQIPQTNVRKAVVIKAVAFKNGEMTSLIYSQTYFAEKHDYTFPVLSITIDSLSLFDYDKGIYVPGKYLDEDNAGWTGNYFKRGDAWEKIGNLEWFNKAGELDFSENVGLRISGQKSRSAPQKSMRLYFRDEYGRSSLKKSIFDNRDYGEHKRIIMRSSFTSWWQRNTLFQDDYIHTLVGNSSIDLDVQMSKPSHLFINGEYWGIHNLRERQDKYYFENIHNVDQDSINVVNGNGAVEVGSGDSYLDLLDFIANHDLTIKANYNEIEKFLDIKNFMDYMIVETYFGNRDWPGNNVKLWSKQKGDTRWRWLLYDLDAAIGDVNLNPFTKLQESDVKLAIIYNGLMKNEGFKTDFVSRYIYHLENSFAPISALSIFDEFKSLYDPEISHHITRWQIPKSYDKWQSDCDYLENFLNTRPCVMKNHLINEFGLDNLENFNCLYEQSDDFETIKLFPNPSSGQFTMLLDLEGNLGGTVTIYNNIGQAVYSNAITSVVMELDLSFLSNGFYTVNFRNNQISASEKIIIQK